MVRAMQSNDRKFDGRFWVGVHSTGIYCLPSCRAKLPLLQNVRFYPSREEAIAAGLRACKRCRSDRFPDRLPEWLHQVLRIMRENSDSRLTASEMSRLAGVNESTVRRYFHEHFGTSPAAFHRCIRLNRARQMIEDGSDYLSAAFEAGYESSSGFRTAFVKQFGFPPGRLYEQHRDSVS